MGMVLGVGVRTGGSNLPDFSRCLSPSVRRPVGSIPTCPHIHRQRHRRSHRPPGSTVYLRNRAACSLVSTTASPYDNRRNTRELLAMGQNRGETVTRATPLTRDIPGGLVFRMPSWFDDSGDGERQTNSGPGVPACQKKPGESLLKRRRRHWGEGGTGEQHGRRTALQILAAERPNAGTGRALGRTVMNCPRLPFRRRLRSPSQMPALRSDGEIAMTMEPLACAVIIMSGRRHGHCLLCLLLDQAGGGGTPEGEGRKKSASAPQSNDEQETRSQNMISRKKKLGWRPAVQPSRLGCRPAGTAHRRRTADEGDRSLLTARKKQWWLFQPIRFQGTERMTT
jgi:hypothetical protein